VPIIGYDSRKAVLARSAQRKSDTLLHTICAREADSASPGHLAGELMKSIAKIDPELSRLAVRVGGNSTP
jgi:hypothetical protein